MIEKQDVCGGFWLDVFLSKSVRLTTLKKCNHEKRQNQRSNKNVESS